MLRGILFLLLIAVFATQAFAVSVEMVRDLNTFPISQSSRPSEITPVGNLAYFSADDGVHGAELWVTDGTDAGTKLFADLNPGPAGSNPQSLTSAGPFLYFEVHYYFTEPEAELWRTDGSPQGTQKIRAGFRDIFEMVPFQNGVIFAGVTDQSGAHIWKSDGTDAGTISLGGQLEYFAQLFNAGAVVYFSGSDSATGTELWSTDGTAEGTKLVSDINHGSESSYPNSFKALDSSTVVFVANDGTHGSELWRTGGTSDGTRLIKDIRQGAENGVGSPIFRQLGSYLYFAADDGTHGDELWRTNGTPEGTSLVANIRPGRGSSLPVPEAVYQGVLYFTATEATHGREVWRTEGEAASTKLFKDLTPGTQSTFFGDFANAGILYIATTNGLWTSDGTVQGTTPIPAKVTPVICSYRGYNCNLLYNFGPGTILFVGANPERYDPELWISKGTAATTHRIKDIRRGNYNSNPVPVGELSGQLVFSAFVMKSTDTVEGLWRTDGTEQGTRQVVSAHIENPGSAGGSIWYSNDTRSTSRWHLFRVDSSFGTHDLGEIPYSAGNFTAYQGSVYFSTAGQLWKTDGVNKQLVSELRSGNRYFVPSKMLVAGDTLFILAQSEGNALFISDGAAAGTRLLKYFHVKVVTHEPGDAMIAIGSTVFFLGSSQKEATQLWKSDGTEKGTVAVKTIGKTWPPASIAEFVSIGQVIYFAASADGYFLWRSDGTESGTYPLPQAGIPNVITAWNENLYYNLRSDSEQQYAFVKFNETMQAPVRIYGTYLTPVSAFGDHLYLYGNDADHGLELWATDGTAQGTSLVKDILPGPGTSYPDHFFSASTGFYFSANDGFHGVELWRLSEP